MAHHIFRRCLLADVVPPVPTTGDYRLFVGQSFSVVIDATGLEFGTSLAGLDVLGRLVVQPIPPGVDTGLGYYTLEVGVPTGPAILFRGIEINGAFAAGGITV